MTNGEKKKIQGKLEPNNIQTQQTIPLFTEGRLAGPDI